MDLLGYPDTMNNHSPVLMMVMQGPIVRCAYRHCRRPLELRRHSKFCGDKCYKAEWDTKRLGRDLLKRGRPKTSPKQKARNRRQSKLFKTNGGRGKYKSRADKKSASRYGVFAEVRAHTFKHNGISFYG